MQLRHFTPPTAVIGPVCIQVMIIHGRDACYCHAICNEKITVGLPTLLALKSLGFG